MTTQPELATAFLAAAPLLLVVVLMLVFRWNTARAGLAALVMALVFAIWLFDYGDRVYGDLGAAGAVGGAMLEAFFSTATILWIIGPAICLYNLQKITGGIDVLCDALGKLSTDRRMVALLVAWFFALFIEGAAGFGTPIALAAPFLVSAGFTPVQAVTLGLVGHAVGVSFGALGTPLIPQIQASGITALELSRVTGIYHGLLGWIMLSILVYFIKSGDKTARNNSSLWGWAILAGATFFVPYFLISYFVGPELPTLAGAFIGGFIFIGVMLLFRGASDKVAEPVSLLKKPGGLSLLRAAGPYLTVIALVLITRLLPPVRNLVFPVEWTWEFAEVFHGSFRPLFHPGTPILLAFISAILWLKASRNQLVESLTMTLRQLVMVTVALAAMLGLARIMVHSGMIELTAVTLAGIAGISWPVFTPFIGVLGSFVTGSATASNILFTDFQQAAAQELDLPIAIMLGAQGLGAAIGNIVCPHNIIAGGATVGLKDEEGIVLRKTLPPCLLYAALGGLLAFILVR